MDMSLHTITDPTPNWSMLKYVTGTIMFSTASPEPFMSVTGAQGQPALICDSKLGSKCWAVNMGPSRGHCGPLVDTHEVCFCLFGQRHSHQCPAGSYCVAVPSAPSLVLKNPDSSSVVLHLSIFM